VRGLALGGFVAGGFAGETCVVGATIERAGSAGADVVRVSTPGAAVD
jgi:hypothetical protein